MKFTYLLALFMAFIGANAWSFTATTNNNFCGKRRTFYSATGANDCYPIPDDVAGNIHSGSFCTMPWTRCSITLHSKIGCRGETLGSSDKSWPDKWNNGHITSKNKKARSFRIQGCKKIGTTLDMTNCYNNNNPWDKC